MKAGEQVNYLVLALLDSDLRIIPGTDIMVDMNIGPFAGQYWRQFLEDCKIWLLRGSFYLMCNERFLKVKITRKGRRRRNTNQQGGGGSSIDKATAHVHVGQDTELPYRYHNIYGDGLELTLLSGTKKIGGGKNFHIFRAKSMEDLNATNSRHDYYLQTYPLPHQYRRLHIPHASDESPLNPYVNGREFEQVARAPLPRPSFDGPDTLNTIATCPEPTTSKNCTNPVEEPFFRDNDHGTTCCLPLSLSVNGTDTNSNSTTVLVGISHAKLTLNRNAWWKRDIYGRYDHYLGARYLSRFVAYSAAPPFDIVARSGWFCLGFGDIDGNGGNALAGRNTQYRLDLFNETFHCPMIHFASSLVEYVGDPSKAILAYGVSDCYPRMTVIEKDDIARLLLGG
jgi:hypothetical protein